MKISLEWLSDFVTWTEKDPHAIANRLTLGSAEVEEVEEQGKLMAHCCVGKVLTVDKHPEADRLTVCTVETDKGTKTVVCGGTNVKAGMLVAFAHVGATVRWHGTEMATLAPVKIRGIASEGMICAGEELDVMNLVPPEKEDGERPIMNLSRLVGSGMKLKVGQDLREALGMTDTVLHMNNTAITTRPDLFSHAGFARECVALGLATWKKKKPAKEATFPATKSSLHLKVESANLVPRYLSCMIEVKSLGDTPEWMKKRLMAVGWNSINLPVDITNYVATEIGVPLHSFDADDIKGDVHLRLSKKGESITTLDGVMRMLPDGALVLSDDEGVFDLLGIMGGLRSSTKDTTKHIYLHAPMPDPSTIRRTVLATGHRTDAATVYEKGVPAITTERGFFRALELMLELIPGATVISSLENKGDNGEAPTIPLSLESVTKTIGVEISEKEVTDILTDLAFDVRKGPKKGTLTIVPPLDRLRDIAGAHDVIEEIGRIHGFNDVDPMMPAAALRIPKRDDRVHKMRDELKAKNFMEIVPLTFVSSDLLKKAGFDASVAVEVENPLGEETAFLQTSTLPHLLAHTEKNLLLAGDSLRTFHWSHVFNKGSPEHLELGLLHASRTSTNLLHDPFLELKTSLTHALAAAGATIEIEPAKNVPQMAHPGRVADVKHNGKTIGMVFEVHPTVRKHFDIDGRAAAAVVDLSLLLQHVPATKPVESLPLFPSVTYDVTLTRTQKDRMGELLKKAKHANPLLEEVSIHDLFEKQNAYNVTLRFTYRSPEKTLTEAEAKAAHEKVLGAIGA